MNSRNYQLLQSQDGLTQLHAIDLFQKGKTIPKIAKKLEISRARIIRCIPDDIIDEKISELLNQGQNYRQIGKKLGIAGITVKRHSIKANLLRNQTKSIITMFLDEVSIKNIATNLNMDIKQVISRIPHSIKRKRLEELYIRKKLLYKEIAKKIGISTSSVRNWLKKYNLMNRKSNAGMEHKKYPKKKIIKDYLHLYSISSIVRKRRFPASTICRILEDAGVNRTFSLAKIRKHVKGNYNKEITSSLKEVLYGELLGDSSIKVLPSRSRYAFSKRKYLQAIEYIQFLQKQTPTDLLFAIPKFNNSMEYITKCPMARFRLGMTIIATPWVEHIRSILEKNGISTSKYISDALKTAAKHHSINMWSSNTIQFNELYELWYSNGIKIVPQDLQMSPTTLLHWFIGDGSSNLFIEFSTHSFSIDEVKFLIENLNNTLGIHSRWRNHKNKYMIMINRRKDINIFYNYLEQANFKSLSLARTVFPWKFDSKTRKRDVLLADWYPEVLCQFLQGEKEKISFLIREVIENHQKKMRS